MINFFAIVALVASVPPNLPPYVASGHAATLQAWLVTHSGFRLAVDDDCNCKSDIEELRHGSGGKWKAQPSYHPFYVAGDFNSDGKEDFAVVLLKDAQRFVAVFNDGSSQPAFLGSKGVGGIVLWAATSSAVSSCHGWVLVRGRSL